MSDVKPVPEGYHTLTPYLLFEGCSAAIEFYKRALGASEIMRRLPGPGGTVGHAELQIGDSRIFMADLPPGMPGRATPKALGGVSCSFHLYVEDVDGKHQRALAAGAKEDRPPADQFYGDRVSQFTDPFGYIWHLATHIKDMTPEEMAAAAPRA